MWLIGFVPLKDEETRPGNAVNIFLYLKGIIIDFILFTLNGLKWNKNEVDYLEIVRNVTRRFFF